MPDVVVTFVLSSGSFWMLSTNETRVAVVDEADEEAVDVSNESPVTEVFVGCRLHGTITLTSSKHMVTFIAMTMLLAEKRRLRSQLNSYFVELKIK